MDTLKPIMTPLLILIDNTFCGSLNINELNNWKFDLKFFIFKLVNTIAQSIFVKGDDFYLSISDVTWGFRMSIARKTTFTYIGAHPEYLTNYIQPCNTCLRCRALSSENGLMSTQFIWQKFKFKYLFIYSFYSL